jgi:hypothetical protein
MWYKWLVDIAETVMCTRYHGTKYSVIIMLIKMVTFQGLHCATTQKTTKLWRKVYVWYNLLGWWVASIQRPSLTSSSGNDVMGVHCLLFLYIIDAPSCAAIDQWGLVDGPISKPFARSCCTWSFGSEQPNQCCLKTASYLSSAVKYQHLPASGQSLIV